MSLDPCPPSVRLIRDDHANVLVFEGDWLVSQRGRPDLPDLTLPDGDRRKGLCVHLKAARWDSALPAALTDLARMASIRGIDVDFSRLPSTLQTLVDLSATRYVIASPDRAREGVLERVGLWTRQQTATGATWLGLIGHIIERLVGGGAGRSRSRRADWAQAIENAGVRALPIIALVNLLIGAVLAFVGAVQLQRFGAEIFVANLVGISVAREMAAVMSGIVLAGRTGAAYAAEIATMQANEEIDALAVLGIATTDYIVLPRLVTLVLLSPLLYLYAAGFGVLGGLATSVTVLDLTPAAYLQQTLKAVQPVNFAIGALKSVAFGACIALIGCQMGLSARRSSADVGLAATRAAVAGIVAVIVTDAIFALCANAMGV